MKRILITGGSGFIGSNLVAALYDKNYDITVLDNLSEQIHGKIPEASPLFQSIRDKVHFIRGSICDRDKVEEALRGQDIVVHYAAETGTGQSMYMVDHYTRVNIQATAMMLDILGAKKDHGIKRILVASSRSIYGEGKYLGADNRPVYPAHRNEMDMQNGRFDLYDVLTGLPLTLTSTDEESLIHPTSVYGITKQVQEQLVMTVSPLLGIEAVVLRYQNVYGPGQSLSNPYTGILSIFSNLIMQGGDINIFEDGLESRDFVYIDDVVDATVRAIELGTASGNVYNVGSGIPTTVLDVVRHLKRVINLNVPTQVTGNYRLGDIRHNYADLTRISEHLGYRPMVSFSEGIKIFADWAVAQGPINSTYEESIAEMKRRGLMRQIEAKIT
ncbi:NAD-dependent epimerase/dehydratase family protein [Polynucleobacter sphagniphilus]|uniref:NAD-dependent epimerase/dehydratase family protein n=1 Tax=Polynucleobacter sphagniphilus TaxID=1743169 RepID=UPI002474E9EC|nr:NAD-dependent epimerase/dehydratase family protein [Polynucleobacter sphagniphilus]MDH6525583.1 dTDP-L-rhamnose 4-epimerase [Polynucleobacter sphagniphilus]